MIASLNKMESRVSSSNKSTSKGLPHALLLGMVFSEEQEPKRGQEYRDRVRCEAMEDLGYKVFTLDNKHQDYVLGHGKHCQANFADARRMFRSIKARWGSAKFDHIILDYFFSPVGWARERWTDNFFRETLPRFATDNVLSADGEIWLPNLNCVQELMESYADVLQEHFTWELVADPKKNPLYLATEAIEDELLLCPDTLTNETQIRPLTAFSPTPFYLLKRRPGRLSPPSTPSSHGQLTDRETDNEDSPEQQSKGRRGAALYRADTKRQKR